MSQALNQLLARRGWNTEIGQARPCVLPLGIHPHSDAREWVQVWSIERGCWAVCNYIPHSFLDTLWGGIQHGEPLAQCGPWRQCTVKLVVFTVALFILYL